MLWLQACTCTGRSFTSANRLLPKKCTACLAGCANKDNTFSTSGGLSSITYCCVPTTSSLPCCQASSLVTVPGSKGLHDHSLSLNLGGSSVSFELQKYVVRSKAMFEMNDGAANCLLTSAVTFASLGQHTTPQRYLAEQKRLLDQPFSYPLCLQTEELTTEQRCCGQRRLPK